MMTEIRGEIASGVPVITLKYDSDAMLSGGSDLENGLLEEYTKLCPNAKTQLVVLHFDSEVAGSPVIRALIKMYGPISSGQKGQLVVANYPPDFLPALQALGVTSLRGFRLVANRDAGIEVARA